MSEDQAYKDGDIVWVKLGNNWWPGEVIDAHRHPDGVVTNIKRKLYCIVKFFNENAYEYVSNVKQIYPFQCAKKDEFLKKGLSLYKSGNKFMEKFPEDVEVAERLTRPKVPSLYINDRPDSIVKAILGQPLVLTCDDEYCGSSEYREKRRSSESITKIINITPNKASATATTPAVTPIRIEQVLTAASSSSNASKNTANNISISSRTSIGDTSSRNNNNSVVNANNSNNNNYRCNLCDFTSVRQNVMILHRKMHSNRNGPMSMPNRHHPVPPNRNKNNNINIIDSNTKVKTINITKSSHNTTTNITPKASLTASKTPSKVVANETFEAPNSPKRSLSTIVIADSSSCDLVVSPPTSNETQSRRSMRHLKTATVVAATSVPPSQNVANGSTSSIDLPIAKPIKKIPKKRDFANLNLQQEDEIPPVLQEVQIHAITPATTPPLETPSPPKGNVEEIRNMLLADWSDEDETPDHDQDGNGSGKAVTSSNGDKITHTKEIVGLSSDLAKTSTPVNANKSLSMGRIRNIPKKDRRDVILHDFSSDISIIESEKESSSQAIVVNLDSSNSSAVEVMEEEQSDIITINDDEENAGDKMTMQNNKKKGQTTGAKSSPSRQSDLENVEPNDKSIVASILSCFDFQDDEDDDDIETPTAVASSIAHFKKKYLSSEKSQNQMSNDVKEKHEERAKKDQELTAEIESLLEQTQPAATDLLSSTNSIEESMSVKDLPIKERGKRIFKSRNRSRIEGKSSTESLTNSMSTDDSFTKDVSTSDANNKTAKDKRASRESQSQNKECANAISSDDIIIVSSEGKFDRETEDHIQNGKTTNEESSEVAIEIQFGKENDIPDVATNDDIVYVSEEDNSYGKDISKVTENDEVVSVHKEANKNLNESNEAEINEAFQESIAVENDIETESKRLETSELVTENIQYSISNDEIVGNQPMKSSALKTTEEPIANKNPLTVPITNTDVNKVEEKELNKTSNIKENHSVYRDKDIPEKNENKQNEEVAEEDKTNNVTLHKTPEKITQRNVEQVKSGDKGLAPISTVVTEAEQATPIEEFANNRMINPSPTDENSSMGASDTGAEFGSPASMLSEERLPAFPFKRTETPQLEIECTETNTEIIKNTPDHDNATNTDSRIGMLTECLNAKSKKDKTNTKKEILRKEDKDEVKPTENQKQSVSSEIATKQTVKNTSSSTPGETHIHKSRHIKCIPRQNIKEVFKNYVKSIQASKKAVNNDLTKNVFTENNTSVQEEKSYNSDELSESERTASHVINTTVPLEQKSEKEVEKLLIIAEDPVDKKEIIKDSCVEKCNDQVEKIIGNIEEEPIEAIESTKDPHQLKVTSAEGDDMDCNKGDKIEKPMKVFDKIEKEINVENTLSEQTTANKTNDNNSPRQLEADSENSTPESNEPKESANCILNQSQIDSHNMTKTHNAQDDQDKSEEKRNRTSRQKKRSGAKIVLDKSKLRKQPIVDEETTEKKHHADVVENIEDITENEAEGSIEISNKIDTESIESLHNDPPISERPEDETCNPKSPTTSDKLQPQESVNEKNSINSGGHNVESSLSSPTSQEKEVIVECETLNTQSVQQQKDSIAENESIVAHAIDFDIIVSSPMPQSQVVGIEFETSQSQNKDIFPEQKESVVLEASKPQVNNIIGYVEITEAPIASTNNVIIVSTANSLSDCLTTSGDHIVLENIENKEHVHVSEKDKPIVSVFATGENETDADKATQEFLIEFDNLVNQTTEQDVEVINAENIINDIIIEVQEENRKEADEFNCVKTTAIAVETGEPTEVTNIGTPTTSSAESTFKRKTPIKRRQTICVTNKRQIFDFEDSFPTTATITPKRTAERKMTMPDIDRPRPVSPFGFDKQFKSFKPRRRSSIEENITSFLIQRPTDTDDGEDLFSELYETPSSTSSSDARYQQLGVDSRGNKYVIIKPAATPTPATATTSTPASKTTNGRNMKRKASQTKTTSRRSSVNSDNPPLSKIPRDTSGFVQICPKPDPVAAALNDNQLSTAQQQLKQLQQQQPQTQSSSIILNKNSNRSRKKRKTPAQSPKKQQQNTNQVVVQQIQIQQNALQQEQLQQQIITQLASQQNVLQYVTQPVPQQHILQQANEGFIITTTSEDDNVIDSNTQLIALPTQPYPGYADTFLLCKVKGNTYKPVDNVPLYLNHQLNELVPIPSEVLEGGPKNSTSDTSIDIKQSNTQQLLVDQNKSQVPQITIAEAVNTDESIGSAATDSVVHQEFLQDNIVATTDGGGEATADLTTNNGILLNIEGQQVLLDAATFAHLLENPDTNTQLISDDGTEYVLTHEVLQALHMQQQQQQQAIPNAEGGNNDIIAVAMAGSDLYDNGVLTIDASQTVQLIDGSGSVVFQQPTVAPALVQQHPPAVVTNAVLDQSPIMSTLEVPSNSRLQVSHCITVPTVPIVTPSSVVLGGNTHTNLDDSLAAIGVTAQSSAISSSLGLPITVTDPNIASKVTSAGPRNEILQIVPHRPATAQATAAAVAAAALAGESRIFSD